MDRIEELIVELLLGWDGMGFTVGMVSPPL